MPRVIVGLTFNDELDLLEIRLEEMSSVDRFVIVEAPISFSGHSKPLHYAENRQRFERWWPKIDHMIAFTGLATTSWQYEADQRNWIHYGMIGYEDTDVMLVSDCDEIIRDTVIQQLKRDGIADGQLLAFRCATSYLFMDTDNYGHGVCTKAMRYSTLRDRGGPQAVIKSANPDGFVEDAGWHFHFCMSPSQIRNKLETWSHTEWNTDGVKDSMPAVRDAIRNNKPTKDMFGRDFSISRVDMSTLPVFVQQNTQRFADVLL